MSIVTLTTDFGTEDHYVAAMKGVILSINPRVTIVDITHAIPPQDVRAGAFELANAAPYFPPGTVHVAVIDPGVGSERRPIALRFPPRMGLQREALTTFDHFFVGPDNGVLTLALGPVAGAGMLHGSYFAPSPAETIGKPTVNAIHLTNRKYWRPDVSRTFHGRDIFAPVAAHLSKGGLRTDLMAELGETLTPPPVQLNFPPVVEQRDVLIGTVIHIDRFGNCISNILEWRVTDRREDVRIEIGGRTINGIRRTYADAARGEILALIGSSGYLEIAVRDGDAAKTLSVQAGDEIQIK